MLLKGSQATTKHSQRIKYWKHYNLQKIRIISTLLCSKRSKVELEKCLIVIFWKCSTSFFICHHFKIFSKIDKNMGTALFLEQKKSCHESNLYGHISVGTDATNCEQKYFWNPFSMNATAHLLSFEFGHFQLAITF